MGLTCDLVIETTDGRFFERILMFRTNSMLDAVAIAEREVAKWDSTARIVELNLQDHGEGSENEQDVYVALMREIVRQASPKDRLIDRLKAKFSFAAQKESRP